MTAFVLSGGGNRGALQVSALQALFKCGIVSDILVGTSAGAVNGAYIATKPPLEAAQSWPIYGKGLLKRRSTPAIGNPTLAHHRPPR